MAVNFSEDNIKLASILNWDVLLTHMHRVLAAVDGLTIYTLGCTFIFHMYKQINHNTKDKYDSVMTCTLNTFHKVQCCIKAYPFPGGLRICPFGQYSQSMM